MKKGIRIFICLLAMIAFLSVSGGTSYAAAEGKQALEITPHFVYTQRTEKLLYGLVELPADGTSCFVRATYCVPQGAYFILILPVVNGEFHAWIFCHACFITLELVDRQDAFYVGTYTAYDTIGMSFPDALYQNGW